MSAAARWDPERQRRALRLMGIEPPAFRTARAPAKPEAAGGARLRIVGIAEPSHRDALLAAIVRSLGVSMREVAFGAGPDLPALAFGTGVPDLPGLQALRADPRAKRTAWQAVLRPLAARVRKS